MDALFGPHGFYVAWSYAIAALVVVVELAALRRRRRQALEEARLSASDESLDAARNDS
jgi:heme exporter protein CcmD